MSLTNRTKQIFAAVDDISRWVHSITLGIAAILCAVIFTLLCLAVITRPWSNFIFGLSFEIGGMLMWPIAFLPLAAVWRMKGHVRFDLALRLTRGRSHHVLELMTGLLVLAIMLLITWQALFAFDEYFSKGRSTLTFRFQVWPAYLGVVVGCFALVLEIILSIYVSITEIISPTGIEEKTYNNEDTTVGML